MPRLPTFRNPVTDTVMVRSDLPARIERWNMGRKAMVLDAIRVRAITPEEVMARYEISAEELEMWVLRQRAHGLRGLTVRSSRKVRS